ncbi:STAS domain-containing protein [Kitasatospora sp. NPDC086009]|uniref:STAS domain-containing protein n=1 Tax=unclassified Kitasatospora TaxID=2633591 RepID=UPI0037C80288
MTGRASTGGLLAVSCSEERDGVVVCTVNGALDIQTAGTLQGALRQRLAATPPPEVLAVDLRGVGFCDSTGLNALLLLRSEAERAGTSLRLAGVRPRVWRVLDTTGTATVFAVHARAADIRPARTRSGAG